jgi:hypothetical protein
MLSKIERVKNWLLHKSPELSQLSLTDALLAKIIISIRQEACGRTFESVPLTDIRPLHPIDRQTAREKVLSRAAALESNKQSILESGIHVSNNVIEKYMPSVSPIQVVRYKDHFLSFEGNGRLQALQQVFLKDGITVDAEVFLIREKSAIWNDIERLLKMYSDIAIEKSA